MARFKCNLCGFETDDAVTFASHILSAHTEIGETKAVEKPQTKAEPVYYECELCDAKFATPAELEKHYYEAHPEEMKKIEEELRKQGIIPPEGEGEAEKPEAVEEEVEKNADADNRKPEKAERSSEKEA